MAKNKYLISVINAGRRQDYYDFWDRNRKVNSSGETLHSDIVGFNMVVVATNLNEAISIVNSKHPNLSIAKEFSHQFD